MVRGRVPMADMLILGFHNDVGDDFTGGAGHQLRGGDRDADVHHGLVVHAGHVRDRRAQAARAAPDAGRGPTRLLGRRATTACRRRGVLEVRAHVRRRLARRQRDHVHDARHLGVPVRRDGLAYRPHIPHVDALDAADGQSVRRGVRHPVRRRAQRAHQHRGNGVRRSAVRY